MSFRSFVLHMFIRETMAHLPTDLMSEINISTPKLSYNSPPLTPTWIDDSNFLLTTLEKLPNWIPSTDS